ncbi:CHAT domain-containing protein, partial [Psychroserpens sp.]
MKRFYKHCAQVIFFIMLIGIAKSGFSQQDSISELKKLDKLISEKKLDTALQALNTNIEDLIAKELYYDVTDYVYYTGKINFELKNSQVAEKTVLDFEKRIISLTSNPKVLRQLKLEVGSFYEFIGDSKTASNYNLEAIEFTKSMPNKNGELFGIIYSNLGVYNARMGNLTTALDFHKKALESYKAYPKTKKERLYITNNSLGGMMWYASKIDSALIYYRKAELVLNELEQTPSNKYLRPAILNNNIAAINSIKGDMDAAIIAMQKTVTNLDTFLKSDISEAKKDDAQEFLFQAIDNYGGIYKDIGDYKKAKELITYSYNQKRKHLNPNSPEISKGKILLGQINLAIKEYDVAEKFLDEGILEFTESASDDFYWLADAYYYKAILYHDKNNIKDAFNCYQKSEQYYKASEGDYYDELYLDFINSASMFYAQNDYPEKASQMANEAYTYIVKNQGEKTLLEYHQILNLANVEYLLKNYSSALEKSKSALELLSDSTFSKNTGLSKLIIQVQKPLGILTKVKSEYELQLVIDSLFLKSKLHELQNAISILEEQKSVLADDNSISVLLSNNGELFEYAKQLALELYDITKSKSYLNVVLGIHESMLYNRIRNRLNSKTSISYANIPKDIIEEEKRLKKALSSSILKNDALESFIEVDKEWQNFLTILKEDYPKYYNLKFASISKSINQQINASSLQDKTLIRYTFIDDTLFAFVIYNQQIEVFKLNSENLTEQINSLQSDDPLSQINFKTLNDLYSSLWKPIEAAITSKKIIIVPDQTLFNLNFEMLTKTVVNSYNELPGKSLLSHYIISYNYSLFLVDEGSKSIGYDNNFIGFAPEFNSKMKSDYELAITDSISMDRTYLTLLPQPFSKNLAQSSSRVFNGESFINENASKQIFTQQAKEHKIIHIGTHAESNNVSPELSRLIFAKNVNDTLSSEDNSLYTYEIYNQNLSSNLAILTACETGKPTYQAGEGMISLAHAFNYAG